MAKFKKTAKQKNKKKENKQLPSNYRTIPEKLNSDKLIFLVGFASVFGAVILISLNVYLAFERQKSLINERFELVKELSFWEREVKEKPDYRDAHMSVALLNFRLKNFTASRDNLEKVFSIDPNFKEGRELEKILDSL